MKWYTSNISLVVGTGIMIKRRREKVRLWMLYAIPCHVVDYNLYHILSVGSNYFAICLS
jgi:hypothetical protein